MLAAVLGLAVGRALDDGHGGRSLTFQHRLMPELMGGPCNCDWISIPGACNTPDGSYCWTYCCEGPAPTPSPEPSPPPSPAGDYEPVALVQEYYLGQDHKDLRAEKNLSRPLTNGFSRQGSMRYHSQKKLNLLGGGLKFTCDLSGVKDLVNANLYLVIPGTLDGGSHFYCDNSATFVGQGNACIELDIMESNGHSLAASTMHTHVGTNSGCDTWGCRGLVYFGGQIDGNRPFDVEVQVANDGDIKVYYKQDGKTATAFANMSGWDQAAKNAVVDGMKNHGAVVMSSMWTGWVPPNTSGNGDLGGSHYTVSNLMFSGKALGNTM